MRRLALLAAAAVLAASGARADEEPGPWDEVVFLPEKGLSVLLERDPKGVLLDRATYLDLHRRARAHRGDISGEPAGWKVAIARGDVEAAVEGERVRATVRLSVALRGGGRETLALPASAAVTGATVDGAPASLGASADGKALLLALRGDGVHEVVLELAAPVDRKGGVRSVAIPLPPAIALRWTLLVPGRVTATGGAGASRTERLENPDRTRIVGYPGAKDPALRASWREGDEGTDLPALVRSSSRSLVEVGERAVTLQALVRFEVSRRPVAAFSAALPEGYELLGVDSESPVSTSATAGGVELRFAEPFTGTRTVLIRAARTVAGPGEYALPAILTPGLGTARLAVRFVEGLRGIVDAGPGALREEAAGDPREGAVDAVFRLAGAGDRGVSVRTERPSPRVEADVRSVVDLAEDGPWIAASFLYRPRGDRLYGVDPRLPAGFTPDSVAVSGNVPHLRSLSPDGRLSVVFPGGIEPGGAVAVTVRGRLPVEGWLAEDWKEKSVPLPRLDAGPVDAAEGRLGVAGPPDLEVREEDAAGMEPAAVTELRERAGFTTEGLTLGYRFRGGAPGGSVRAVRRPATVTSTVAVLAVPGEDHLRCESAVTLTVQRSGIREARIVVRPAAGEELRLEGADVAERRRVPGDGFDTWVVRFSRRVRDGTVVLLSIDRPLSGGAATVPVPSVEGAAREDLFVGLEGGGEREVSAEAKGLRDADPADLAPVLGARSAGLLDAWKGERGGAASLSVKVARLDPAALPSAYADSVALSTVIGGDGIARTRMTAMVRNAERQALEVALPAGAKFVTARVRGEAVRPLRTGAGLLQVPLVRSTEPFEVAIVYEEALDAAGGTATLRAPDLGLPGGLARWTVRLPDGSVASETSGDFAAAPRRPATPLLVRILGGLSVARVSLRGSAKGPPPSRTAPMPGFARGGDGDGEVQADALETRPIDEQEKALDAPMEGSGPPPAAAPAPAPAGPTAVAKPAGERMASRAVREGLFGMDIRLLEAGPAVTATRLSPGGTLSVAWRTSAARTVGALMAGLLAFLAGWIARRRGIGAPTWTVLSLGLLTAAPVVLGATDGAAWDGAALGTLAWAAAASVAGIHRWGLARIHRRAARPAAAALLALLVLSLGSAAGAAEEKKPAKPKPAPPAAGSADTVFVPYDPARPESLKTPERVFLPYARYLELWNASHPEERIEPARPPVVTGASYAARVEGRVLVVDAAWDIDPADGGLVPLPPSAAVEDLLVDGKPAAASSLEGAGVVFPVARAAGPGERRRATAVLRFPVEGREPSGRVSAAIPPAARARLDLVLPLEGAVVKVRSLGGWTETPVDSSKGGGTAVGADLGPVDSLSVAWSPRGADASGGRVRFEAATVEDLLLREDHALLSARVTVEVRSGTLDVLDLALPGGWEPEAVAGPAVASWTAAGEGAARRLLVRLAGAGPGTTEVVVRAVRAGPALGADIEAPDLAVAGAATESVTVRVAAGSAWRIAAAESSAFDRAEPGEAAPGLDLDPARGERVQSSWRRARLPARLSVRAEALPRSLETRSRQHLFLGAGFSLLRADFDLVPGPGGLFETSFDLPAGWFLEEAEGGAAFPVGPRVRLVLAGAGAAPRTVGLRLRGPAAADGAFPMPRLRAEGATRESDEILVSTAPAFTATGSPGGGMESVPPGRFSAWPALDPAERRVAAFRAARGGGSLEIRREALQPAVRPTVVADVTVLDDRAIVDALMVFEVRGGPSGIFRFRSPPGVKDAWVIGDGLREVRTALLDGRETTTVILQAPATGEVLFRVLYEIPVPAGAEVAVSGPEPLDGEAPRAYLFVRAAGEAEARLGGSPGLEPCDVADLPKIPQGLDARRVLRFFRARDAAWRLPLRIVSHEIGDLPEARIHLVEATTVADRDGSSRTRVDARLFNRSRAFLPVEAAAGAELESVTVGGVPVRPVTKPSMPGAILVPVRRQSLGDQSQVVTLIFASKATAPGGRFGSLSPRLPSFPGVPVDATTWRLLLPEDRDYSFSGNLDPVEDVEVEIARAEAYASDVSRLRRVVAEGSYAQQERAGENMARNTEDLRRTLESAQSRLAALDQAVTEGRVDAERVAGARRKAQELNRDLEDALKEVKDKAPGREAARGRGASHGGQYRGPSGEVPPDARTPGDPPPEMAADDARLATKEGQVGKNWLSNEGLREQRQGAIVDSTRQVAESWANAANLKKAEETTVSAFLVHQDFDRSIRVDVTGTLPAALRSLRGENAALSDPAAPDGGGGTPTPPGGGKGGMGYGGGGGGGSHPYAGDGGGGGVVAGTMSTMGSWKFDAAGGSEGGGAALVKSAGVISLAPTFVERGRGYAFRKLDAGAEMTVTARTMGLGRRAGAAGAFLLLVALVWFVRRRRERGAGAAAV